MPIIDGSRADVARKLGWVINEFRQIGQTDLESQTLLVFFLVAGSPGIRMKDIEKSTRLSSSAVSRNVLMLSERSWRKSRDGKFEPGLDLVLTATDPFDPRAKVVSLTPKGRRLLDKIASMMDGTKAQ